MHPTFKQASMRVGKLSPSSLYGRFFYSDYHEYLDSSKVALAVKKIPFYSVVQEKKILVIVISKPEEGRRKRNVQQYFRRH